MLISINIVLLGIILYCVGKVMGGLGCLLVIILWFCKKLVISSKPKICINCGYWSR